MVAVTIFLILTIVLLFVSMVLSAIGANNVTTKNYDVAWKYSMISAVVSGVSVALIVMILIIYLMSGDKKKV